MCFPGCIGMGCGEMEERFTRNGLFRLLILLLLCFRRDSLLGRLLGICGRWVRLFFCCFGSPRWLLSFFRSHECWLFRWGIDWKLGCRLENLYPIVLWFILWVCFWILWFCLQFLLLMLEFRVDVVTMLLLWRLLYDHWRQFEVYLNVVTKWWVCCRFLLSIVV